MASRWQQADVPRGEDYDKRFERLAAAGHDVHGEASFVMGFEPSTVLDAGCGTGRVAIELARRGVTVTGIDLDLPMLLTAQKKGPALEWLQGDLAAFEIPALPDPNADEAAPDEPTHRHFDAVIAVGNVMIFLDPGTEAAVVESLAHHLEPDGVLIAGFQLTAARYGVVAYDRDCAAAGLQLAARYASWSRDPWSIDSGYAVSVHQFQLNESVPLESIHREAVRRSDPGTTAP